MVNSTLLFNHVTLKQGRAAFFLLLLTVSLSGCLAFRPPAELEYAVGAAVETLSGTASLSYAASGRSVSGSGFVLYRKPDQIRVVILSPFGSVLQEIYVTGDQVSIVDTGNGVVYSGSNRDLPDSGDVSGWRYIQWIIDIDPPEPTRSTTVIERTNRYGQQEVAAFENGLLISKTTAAGGHVRYRRYAATRGVAFPLEIIYETVAKEKFTILFEEPEINVPLTDAAFTFNRDKLRVYPLSLLK